MRVLIAIVVVALVCVLGATEEASAQGPVRIGFISPLSGAIAQAGKDMYSGCELYWEENGWQMAGRKPCSRIRTAAIIQGEATIACGVLKPSR